MSSPQQHKTETAPALQMDSVALRYGRGPEILSGVDFELKTGTLSFLTGVSGAGKSTLLRIIGLDLEPSRGLVSLFGEPSVGLPRSTRHKVKRRIGFVSQHFNLIKHLNVFENTALPLRVQGQKRSDYSDNVTDLLRWVGLGDRINHMPETLSSGEIQRVAIARAVVTQPELLIADEPTGNVDPEMSERLLRLFLEMNRGGTTILIATHDQALLSLIRADTYHLSGGTIEQTGSL